MEEVPPPFLYEGGIYMEQLEIMEGILNAYPYPIVFVDNDYIIRFLNRFAKYHYYEDKADKERGKAAKTEKKPSIRAQLKADKEKTAQKKATKSKNHELEV